MKDKELDKELAKKVINPFDFTDEILKTGFEINLESHNISHANSILSIIPTYPEFGVETRYINRILKEMATKYARIKSKINLNFIFYFQLACIGLMKKITEVMKLNF